MLSDERRREIADFLKTRRMRRQPEELGLPRGRRRRTPGLRREEVAAAAGVSAEWYTWLEQAREVRPSAQVLTRIGEALRLEPNETRHLLTLGGYAVPASGSDLPRSVSVSPVINCCACSRMAVSPSSTAGTRRISAPQVCWVGQRDQGAGTGHQAADRGCRQVTG